MLSIGYSIRHMSQAAILEEIKLEQKELRFDAILTAMAGIGLVFGVIFQIFEISLLVIYTAFLVTYLAGGLPAAKEAFTDLRKGSLNIDLLMVLAALAAAGVGEVRDGAILLFLFSLAGTLEAYAMGSTKRAVASLMSLHPDTAWKKRSDGQVEKIGTAELVIGDVVVVRPGERIPIDGKIISGTGTVDQSSITGESVPVDKIRGDFVFAGTVNQHTVLEVRVTELASHSTLARMIKLVTEAHAKRAPSERFSDWFGERYTIVVLLGSLVALAVFILLDYSQADAFYRAATLLVVASPCAIVISVPAAILSALTAAARRGVLFKGGATLEQLSAVDIVAFDKTGTLTEGKLVVQEVVPQDISRSDLLALALALEEHSEHPVAESICAYVKKEKISKALVTNVAAVPGKGVIGRIVEGDDKKVVWAGNEKLIADYLDDSEYQLVSKQLEQFESAGKTTIAIGIDNQVIGYIALADTVRLSAVRTITALRQAGVRRVVMLSGDATAVAEAIGRELGLAPEDSIGSLLPEDKVRKIEALRKEGRVAFIGDGVNDAAALATADVGVAMGAVGTDVAIEAADVALMSNDLEQLVTAQTIARKASVIIKQNFTFAIGIMVLMVIVTVFFYLPLPLGVIGHEGGTLLVVANGLRLLWQYRG